MMNSLSKRKKIQERIQAPTYAVEVLEPFSYVYNDSMENQQSASPTGLGKESLENNRYIYTFSHSY